jgi:hypothetical protein
MLPDEEGKIAFALDIGTSDLLAVELLDAEAPPPLASSVSSASSATTDRQPAAAPAPVPL